MMLIACLLLWIVVGVLVAVPMVGGLTWLATRFFPQRTAKILGLPVPGRRGVYRSQPRWDWERGCYVRDDES